jgi:hypothetical protein
MQQLCALTRIVVCLCRKKKCVQPVRTLLYDVLCVLRSKSSAIAYEMLVSWPDVIPALKGEKNPQAKFSTIKGNIFLLLI